MLYELFLRKKVLKKHLLKKIRLKKEKVVYTEKKPFLADKEIIFRSGGRARVFNISHRLQFFVLLFVAAVFCWSGYNYYYYQLSEKVISHKEKELDKTRDAYMDLMSDVTALQNNLKDVVSAVDEADDGLTEIKNYKEKAQNVEDKIKQIADSEAWIDQNKIEEKVSKKEALLQKDMVESENTMLRQKIEDLGGKIETLQSTVKGLESAEIAILEKISKLSGKEIERIKTSLSQINKTLKGHGRYFNPLANVKEGRGGAFVPETDIKIENRKLLRKMSEVFAGIDLLENYKSALAGIPTGKPVYRGQISSSFGTRQDPFKPVLAKHKGIDLRAAKGSRISVMAKGKIVSAGYQNNGYGNIVVVDHGNGFVTKYAHMNRIYVKKGDEVVCNQALGEVGRTGRATGDHLHYEIIYRGANLNPLTFVQIKNES